MPFERIPVAGGGAEFIQSCKICDAPTRARLIEADHADGKSSNKIAEEMTAAGWPLTNKTVRRHLRHVPGALTASGGNLRQNEPMPRHKDAGEYIKGKVLDALEAKERRLRALAAAEGREYDGEFILDKDLQPALGTVLKAEGIKIKREDVASKRQIGLFTLMLGRTGGLAPAALIGDGSIEGEFKDVTPRDDEEDEDAEATPAE